MKKICLICLLMATCTLMPSQQTKAQAIVEIIKQGIKKVIVAVDLKIQRLQNKTIWLQNAQKTLENVMSKAKLTEISDWVEKQRVLYADYFDELWKIKAAIAYYHRVKEIIERQVRLVQEYKTAWGQFRQDDHFTADELDYMQQVYIGIFEESLKNLDQLSLVVNAFKTQMSDGKRLEIINAVADQMETNYSDLREFNTQNKLMSLQRASEKGDLELVKRLYGIQ
jgi:hypothetical protein